MGSCTGTLGSKYILYGQWDRGGPQDKGLRGCASYWVLCGTRVCEVTAPSLHLHILRSARGLLLRVNAIVMNPLPFWLKILETFLLYCPGLLLLLLRALPRSDGFRPCAVLLRVSV